METTASTYSDKIGSGENIFHINEKGFVSCDLEPNPEGGKNYVTIWVVEPDDIYTVEIIESMPDPQHSSEIHAISHTWTRVYPGQILSYEPKAPEDKNYGLAKMLKYKLSLNIQASKMKNTVGKVGLSIEHISKPKPNKYSTLTAYALSTDFFGKGTEKSFDHTFVYCNTDIDGVSNDNKTFQCWSDNNHTDSAVPIASGTALHAYEIANCYRYPAFGRKDTAGIGIYLYNGVCHQSANCFLFAANAGPMWYIRDETKDTRPNGLWASYLLYGPYGAVSPGVGRAIHASEWVGLAYKPCKKKFQEQAKRSELPEENLLISALQKLYSDSLKRSVPIPTEEFPAHEASTIAQYYGIDISPFFEKHIDLLNEKNEILTPGTRRSLSTSNEDVAKKLNDLAVRMQDELEKSIGRDNYEKLTGMPSGQQALPIDVEIAKSINYEN
ncbi:hypothetical protein FBQ81_01250 [Chloroflexi bacterium CFX6]|nr:hypothetical protein [Chloroflexi bacterium CFX6]